MSGGEYMEDWDWPAAKLFLVLQNGVRRSGR